MNWTFSSSIPKTFILGADASNTFLEARAPLLQGGPIHLAHEAVGGWFVPGLRVRLLRTISMSSWPATTLRISQMMYEIQARLGAAFVAQAQEVSLRV